MVKPDEETLVEDLGGDTKRAWLASSCNIMILSYWYMSIIAFLPRPRRGLRGIVFTRSVCVSVCVSVCPANILVFYLSAIRRDIDLKFMQDTYMVVLNSLK